jgi:hypothetical protein
LNFRPKSFDGDFIHARHCKLRQRIVNPKIRERSFQFVTHRKVVCAVSRWMRAVAAAK